MKKIKILFYSHTIDFAGTWRSHERIIRNLNTELFDPYIFYNPNSDNNRLEVVKEIISDEKLIPFVASKKKTGPETGYSYIHTNFEELCKKFSFDIIHFARSGYYEWPFVSRICPVQIETNIFGFRDDSKFLDHSVTICETINKKRGGSDSVVYNPIPRKIEDQNNLLLDLNIPENYFVFGRIGRKDNFDPIALNAIAKLKYIRQDFRYVIIGACSSTIKKIQELGLDDVCIMLETTNDDYFIHKFYNTIDLFLHYRKDGECHSTAISQALSYGVPVISHYAGQNGQSETIRDGGFVVNNESEYLDRIIYLIENKEVYDKISNNALIRSQDFDEKKITERWEQIYLQEHNNK